MMKRLLRIICVILVFCHIARVRLTFLKRRTKFIQKLVMDLYLTFTAVLFMIYSVSPITDVMRLAIVRYFLRRIARKTFIVL